MVARTNVSVYTEARTSARAVNTAGCDTNDVPGSPGMAADVTRLNRMSGGLFWKWRDAQRNRQPPENSSNCVER